MSTRFKKTSGAKKPAKVSKKKVKNTAKPAAKEQKRRLRPDALVLTSRHLGTIASDYAETKLGDVRVDLNLNDLAAVTQTTIDEVDRTIDALDALRATAVAIFAAALGDPASEHDQVEKFWEFHHDEVDPTLERNQFVAALQLKRAGLYPDGTAFVVLDFAVRGPNTDQLLVANFSRDRSLDHVSWES